MSGIVHDQRPNNINDNEDDDNDDDDNDKSAQIDWIRKTKQEKKHERQRRVWRGPWCNNICIGKVIFLVFAYFFFSLSFI